MAWSTPGFPPRTHVHYLRAVGLLRVLASQLREDVRLTFDQKEWSFVLSIDQDEVNNFLLTNYKPSHVFSPWNARTFGSGFTNTLKVARTISQLAEYVACVEASEISEKPAKKGGRGELSPKEQLIDDLLTEKKIFSPSQTEWTRACWRRVLPKTKRGKVNVKARKWLGFGGCAGSMDYGSLFLKAAVAHFTQDDPHDWSLGGFCFPDRTALDWGFNPGKQAWYSWSALDVLLVLEGAISVSNPFLGGDGSVLEQWQDGQQRHLPICHDEVTWAQAREVLASGWDGAVGITRKDVWATIQVKWLVDAQLERATCNSTLSLTQHRKDVRVQLVRSSEKAGLYYSQVWYAQDTEPYVWFESHLGEKEEVFSLAQQVIQQSFGSLANVSYLPEIDV